MPSQGKKEQEMLSNISFKQIWWGFYGLQLYFSLKIPMIIFKRKGVNEYKYLLSEQNRKCYTQHCNSNNAMLKNMKSKLSTSHFIPEWCPC